MENIDNNSLMSIQQRYEEWKVWHMPEMTKRQFYDYMEYYAKAYMYQRGHVSDFIIDENNRACFTNMYYYITNDPRGKWNPDKGVFLGGKVGAGKTLLMRSFCKLLEEISGYVIEMIPARQLARKIIENGIESYLKRPLFIDELGRENLEENYYGRIIRPFEELISYRYEYGVRIFITSNFKPERLGLGYDDQGKKIGYGQYIYDRLKEACTFDVLPGESRR